MIQPEQIYQRLFDELYYDIDQNGIYEEDELIYQVRILIHTLCDNNINILYLMECSSEVIGIWQKVKEITIQNLTHE